MLVVLLKVLVREKRIIFENTGHQMWDSPALDRKLPRLGMGAGSQGLAPGMEDGMRGNARKLHFCLRNCMSQPIRISSSLVTFSEIHIQS